MKRAPAIAIVVIFAIFMLAPAVSLVVAGYSRLAENPPTWLTVDWARFVSSDMGYRTATAKAVLTGAPVGIGAVSVKSRLDYDIFGFVNTSNVISGKENWLFFKQDSAFGKCNPPERIAEALNSVVAMRYVAEAAGIDLRFAIAPDKTTVYPTMLGSRAAAYSRCKLSEAFAWRTASRELGTGIIDHFDALQADAPFQQLYLSTDTHWNQLGMFRAMRQLAQNYIGVDVPPPDPSQVDRKIRPTDLTKMLRIDSVEIAPSIDQYWEGEFKNNIVNSIQGEMIIFHDSFYAGAKSPLTSLFPKAIYQQLDAIDPSSVFDLPPRVLIESVERLFFVRMASKTLSWRGAFGKALIDANSAIARTCQVQAVKDFKMVGLKAAGPSFEAENDPKVLITLPVGGKPCLHLQIESGDSSWRQIFLPSKQGTFSAGLSIDYPPGTQDIFLILPTHFSGKTLRFDPISKAGVISRMVISSGSL